MSRDDPQLSVLATARLITGMIRAFELHADANPQEAGYLRADADTLRATRDDLLESNGLTIEEAKVDYGGSREWTAAFGRLTEGSGDWPFDPSRDPWEPFRR
jgi:hypothetical protein